MAKKYFNKQLITVGAGTLGAMFAAAVGSGQLKKMGGNLSKYAVPVTAGSLVVAGSMMMGSGNAKAKKAGMGVGGVGVSLLANETYKVVSGGTFAGTPQLNSSQPPVPDNVVTV